ncbi:unnamed protein product, partial [Lymnaea stagnalis]
NIRISDEIKDVILTVNYVAVCGVISLVGITANVLNMIVFARLGLNDAINVSLLGLAAGDICSLVAMFGDSVCFNPAFQSTGLPVVLSEVQYVVSGWPQVCFIRVTSWITAFVSLERCLCVTIPFQIKTVVTRRCAKLFVATTFMFVAVTSLPEYFYNQIQWKFYPERNRTLLGIVPVMRFEELAGVTYFINQVVLQCVAFAVIAVCTCLMIVALNNTTRWRQESAKGNSCDISRKDKRMVKMVSLLSTWFIVAYTPASVLFIVMVFKPTFHPSFNYNLFHITWSVSYLLEGCNASFNILIYLKMSTRYKSMFAKTFL